MQQAPSCGSNDTSSGLVALDQKLDDPTKWLAEAWILPTLQCRQCRQCMGHWTKSRLMTIGRVTSTVTTAGSWNCTSHLATISETPACAAIDRKSTRLNSSHL